MFARILGFGDLFAVLVILLHHFIPKMWAAMFLILKGFLFVLMRNLISWLDIFCGIYVIILSWGFSHWLPTTLAVIFLGQKGLLSLF